MKTYKVNEIFHSIQGEGFHAGTDAVFVRFSGCNLKCRFCDTQHDKGTEMDIEEIRSRILSLPNRGILVLTGGEPLLQLDDDFFCALCDNERIYRFPFCIETNGTVGCNFDLRNFMWLTVSPKDGAPLSHDIIPHEIKVVLDEQTDPEKYREFYMAKGCSHFYIQPCFDAEYILRARNTRRAVEYVKTHPGWRLSVQSQRFLNIR